ncbi:unnamed protein product [Thelazia callipaeda]|uniref:DNA-directed primase/polymerase protein n=1 Tax=Thelazia callipaeda TaxID=103827 RepID=A0A0N5CXV9_THECL|nr:unnamed protein product [Thelazia callipaeda]
MEACIKTELNLLGGSEDWFYGQQNRSNQVQKSTKNALNKKKVKLERSLFEESLGCFVIYKRQNEALQKCKQEGPLSRVFAFEHSIYHPGKRHFLVSTVERFWHWYKKQSCASFYELIPQNCPARLYFDLEFYRETNPEAKEKELIDTFNNSVTEVFMEMFQINFNPEKEMVVLDASTPTKFSEHVIVHIRDNQVFPSNISIKLFIQHLKQKMLSGDGCVWNESGTKRVTLFDEAVYSSNRNFRLYLSSKLGKNNPLVLSKRCQFYAQRREISKKQIFLDSLVVPANYRNYGNILQVLVDEKKEYSYNQNLVPKLLPINGQEHLSREEIDLSVGYGATSPFPALDEHIIMINRQWKANACIRQWKIRVNKYINSRYIIYYVSCRSLRIAHCRYCFNINREHRSNGIYWAVDLDRLHCFQKCFDVDCQGISSNYFPLPTFVRNSILVTKDQFIGKENELKMPNKTIEGNMMKSDKISENVLLELISEAKAKNKIKVENQMIRSYGQIDNLSLKTIKNEQEFMELADDDLLRAFEIEKD